MQVNYLMPLLMLALCGNAAAQTISGPSDCRFHVPDTWQQRNVQWDGPCKNGWAEGDGVLRAYPKTGSADKVTRLFLGRMTQGDMRFGVREGEGGYYAGNFRDGALLTGDSRQEITDAFTLAGKVARERARKLQAAGNQVSARYYLNKAEQLEAQMAD